MLKNGNYDVIVSVERSKGHSASEISLLPLRHGVLVVIQVFLGQAKVNNVYVLIVLRQNKVGLRICEQDGRLTALTSRWIKPRS